MKLDVFKKRINQQEPSDTDKSSGPVIPEGLLKKCNFCKSAIIAEDAKRDFYICPKCGGYFHVPAKARVQMIADKGSFEEWNEKMEPVNPMNYKGYLEKIQALQEKTGLNEAVWTGKARIDGCTTALGICDGRFMMASMGHNVGEKITRMVERATEEKLPVVLFCCSGGARMQEGIVSLMQMAKTSAAFKRHSEAGLLYITVLTDPTTGGVTASFAMLGDIILAEPGALIGFAGPRVIEQTMKQKLPKGFQRAEFLLKHGFVDDIVKRQDMKTVLGQYLKLHMAENGCTEATTADRNVQEVEGQTEAEQTVACETGTADATACPEAISIDKKMHRKKTEKASTEMTAWDRVQLSRKKDRPVASAYIDCLFTDFHELHGDRLYSDDAAIVGGIARFHGNPVTVIVQQKGRTTRENIERNFGMPKPEGYRKALRLMKQAEKFHRPIFCIVDTPGAFCGMEAEERGQGEAIARNLYEMSSFKVPILTVVTGEGGSGGALAMAVSDEVWMLENATYSILSPEGFASILWKDAKRADEAAAVMKLTAEDVKKSGIIERVIPEPEELTEETISQVTDELDRQMQNFMKNYTTMSPETLVTHRYERFRTM